MVGEDGHYAGEVWEDRDDRAGPSVTLMRAVPSTSKMSTCWGTGQPCRVLEPQVSPWWSGQSAAAHDRMKQDNTRQHTTLGTPRARHPMASWCSVMEPCVVVTFGVAQHGIRGGATGESA